MISFTLYADEIEFEEKELEHCSLQEKLDMELKELDKRLEEKEVLFSFLECPTLVFHLFPLDSMHKTLYFIFS